MVRLVKRVGITAGASTPTWLIEGVIRRMKELSEEKQTIEQVDALIQKKPRKPWKTTALLRNRRRRGRGRGRRE